MTTDDPTSQAEPSPPLANPPFVRKPAVRRLPRLAAIGLVLTALATLLSFPLRGSTSLQAHAEVAAPPAPRLRWIEITKPYQLYTMDSPEFAKLPRTYAARRLETGNGRFDMLTLGNFGEAGPWLHIGIRRFGNPDAAEPGFYVDVARRAAEAGLAIAHSAAPGQIASRFGALEYASVKLERGEAGATCEAFRFGELGPDLNITGLYCAANGREPEPGAVVCLLDRLALAAAGDDVALRQVFVAAELKREQFCAGSKYRVAQKEEVVPVVAPVPVAAVGVEPKGKRNKRKR